MRAAPAIAEGFARGSGVRTNIRHSAAPKFQRSASSAFSMGATQDLDNPHESTARIIDPGSAGGPRMVFVFCAPGRAGIVTS
jgi:hypothetical protein